MLATAEGARASWEIAESGAASMRANTVLTQCAYVLGEEDLQALPISGRVATAAEQTALSANADATRAYYSVLLDANLLWDGASMPLPR